MEGWNEAINIYWRIAKETNSRSCANFDSVWSKLMGRIELHVAESPEREKQLQWLQDLAAKKKKFCLRYV